jgi:hypothetical protein
VSRTQSERIVIGLIGAQAANAAFDAVAVYPIAKSTSWGNWAKQWGKEDLDRLGFPERFRFVFPIIKGSSALGLLLGLRRPRLGRLTATAVVAYFIAAVAYHAKAKDSLSKYVPAVAMLIWSTTARRSFARASLRRLDAESPLSDGAEQ